MVRVRDVCELMDVRYIQTYVINSARVVFLSERPHPRGKKESGKDDAGMNASTSRRSKGKDEPKKYSACVHCSRTLQAPTADYCSISCKVSAGADMAPTIEAATEAAAESEAAGVGTSGKGAKRDREGDAASVIKGNIRQAPRQEGEEGGEGDRQDETKDRAEDPIRDLEHKEGAKGGEGTRGDQGERAEGELLEEGTEAPQLTRRKRAGDARGPGRRQTADIDARI